jgi:uncharacterized DUF497 family protein
VKIAFDPAKDARNIAKHGISLAMAERLEWDLLLAREDTREGYGEVRMLALRRSVERYTAWSSSWKRMSIGLSACERRCQEK